MSDVTTKKERFTVFCIGIEGTGTIWIGCVEADNVKQAAKLGRYECADAWDVGTAEVHTLGVARGEVEILHWEDVEA